MRSLTFAPILFIVFLLSDALISEDIESLSVHPLVTSQTIGTEFVFAFLSSHFSEVGTEILWVLVSNQDPTQTAQITITSPYPGFRTISTSVGPQEVSRIRILPANLQTQYPNNLTTATTVEDKGLHLVSTLPVTVYSDNERSNGASSDAILILPVCHLSTLYQTINDQSPYFTTSIFSIVAVYDNTVVGFSSTTGSWTNVTLNALQVLTYSHSRLYLTATEVVASAPVAVISGTVCGVGNDDSTICDFETIMLVPEQSWGTQFPLVTFAGDTGNEFTLTANQQTNVYQDSNLLITVQGGTYMSFNLSTSYIWTDKPVQVVQVGKRMEGSSSTGAPFFVHLPPSEQFISDPVQFSTNAILASYTTHYVRITAPLTSVGTIAIDGYTPPELLYVRVGQSDLYFYNIDITPGTHTITPASSSSKYSAIVYGYGDNTGYGFAAGLNLPGTRSTVLGAPTIVTLESIPSILIVYANGTVKSANELH